MVATPLMTVRTGAFVCTVAGKPSELLEADISHGVNQPVGTASLTFAAPLASHITRNAVVEVQAGWLETGGLKRRFHGRIVSRTARLSADGATATVQCAGWASLLAWPDQRDLVYYNSSSLYGIFRSLCRRRGVPAYHADYVRDPSGANDIRLGGVALVDGGNVIIPRLTSPLDWTATKARLFGYRVFDTPGGVVTLQRVSGIPAATTITHAEGVDLLEASHDDTLETYVTYWEVTGARYTDADGVNVAIRSIPLAVPYAAELDPPGYRSDRVSDDSLVTTQLADWARNVLEIDRALPGYTETYRISADPTLAPGMAVKIVSPTLGGLSGNRWLMGLREHISKDGYWMTADVWRGGGTALPAGNDCVTQSIGTGPYHCGDEVVPWYAVPTPGGKQIVLPFMAADDYTSLTVYARAHGSNSYLLDGANADSTVSQFQIWQSGTQISSGELPVIPEDYALQRPYSDDAYWQDIVIPLTGQITAGRAELRIVSGEDSRLPDDTRVDDFEVKNITIRQCGVGVPVLPAEQL